MPISYVKNIDEIFSIGSVCRISATVISDGDYVAHLRS